MVTNNSTWSLLTCSTLCCQFQRGSTHFYHIESDGLRWVGVAGRRLAQLQVLCWLTTLKDAVRSICGAATESVLRANYLILRQLSAEILVSR